ncbi:hypothetical protein RHS01_05511 [Rhizoctonia solani]|uniref:DUF659 domain-containing protein n=1 Tax=Rhizoctonia solani TaxID=456999 RepID=A0A8H7M556_9AGAM|nr:hypothetical protein RHS01_05511 [Rhizoctonia solani]
MPASLWHWQYFQTRPHNLKSPGDRDHYNGGIYANTWCCTCIASCISVMEQEDQKALEEGVISKVQPQTELLCQALSLVCPIPGCREAFEAHIRSCEQIPLEAKDRLASERMRTHSLTPNTENHSKLSPHPAPATIYNLLSKEQQDKFNFDLWPILWTQLEAANTLMHNAISGRLATGMSDGWKNVRRNALIASMLSVDYKTYTVCVHNLSAQHKTAKNHLKLVLSDIDKTKKEHNVRVIAWVSDAGGNSQAMQVQLHRLRPHILVFDCWAHQINLVVGDIMSLTSRLVDTADDAINIIKWMLNHLYLLGLFRQEQAQDGRKPCSLALPVLTQWTSHFLLLNKLKLYLEPLAIAANVSQAATTRLDHILVKLGRFVLHILKSWIQSKDLQVQNNLKLYKAFLDYYNSWNKFHPDQWDYKEQQAMHEQAGKPLNMIHVWLGLLAYKTPNSGHHQLAHLAIHVLSIVANLAGCKQLFSKMGHIHTKRRNWLGYQKVFDTAVVRMDLKRKHADEGRTRSRLKRQFGSPALDSVVLGAGAKRNNQPNKLAESIGNVDAIKEELVTPSVRLLITQLCQDVLNDKDPLDDEPDEPPVATLPKKVRLFFGTQFPIPLRDLFDYSRNTESEVHGLDFFKSNGLNNLDAELELYGLVTRDIQKGLEIDDSTV